jgi:hypothetical protein
LGSSLDELPCIFVPREDGTFEGQDVTGEGVVRKMAKTNIENLATNEPT